MRSFSLSTCLLLAVAPAIHAQAAPATNQTPMHWGPAPAVFPPGARMAVVSGDPSKAELFTVELAMPSGYKIAPHFHPTDETVEVKIHSGDGHGPICADLRQPGGRSAKAGRQALTAA